MIGNNDVLFVQQLQQQQQSAGTKLEKAELLEMTVAYVCRVQNDVSRQMSLGFASCMREVDAFLAQTGNGSEVDTQLRAHLVRRLSRCRRRLGSAVLADQTGSRRRAEDQPPSSSTSTSGCGLRPRKLCFDDAHQMRSVRGTVLRDINDNTRYDQLASGDVYRRSTTLSTGSENTEFLSVDVQQLNTATIGVDSHISSTTSTSASLGRNVERHEAPSRWLRAGGVQDNVAALNYSYKSNVATVKDEPLTPVWRPW